MQKKT